VRATTYNIICMFFTVYRGRNWLKSFRYDSTNTLSHLSVQCEYRYDPIGRQISCSKYEYMPRDILLSYKYIIRPYYTSFIPFDTDLRVDLKVHYPTTVRDTWLLLIYWLGNHLYCSAFIGATRGVYFSMSEEGSRIVYWSKIKYW